MNNIQRKPFHSNERLVSRGGALIKKRFRSEGKEEILYLYDECPFLLIPNF